MNKINYFFLLYFIILANNAEQIIHETDIYVPQDQQYGHLVIRETIEDFDPAHPWKRRNRLYAAQITYPSGIQRTYDPFISAFFFKQYFEGQMPIE